MDMQAKFYSLDEARSVLPRVKELMGAAQTARREIMQLRPNVWPLLRKAASNGGGHEGGELFLQFGKLEAGIKGIMAMGIFVKDIDQGLVDFLGKRDGREVFLCWHYGEDDIAYWHDLNAGFAGRQPIDALVS